MKKTFLHFKEFIFIYLLSNIYFSQTFAATSSNANKEEEKTNIIFEYITTDLLVNIVLACLVIVLTLFISKFASSKLTKVLENSYGGKEDGREELTGVLTRTINVIILGIGFAITLTVLGIDMGIFLGGLGFGIGFTLKIFLTNFIAGILMVTQGFYHIGDTVEVGGKVGRIKNIHALFTSIEQFDGLIFYIPNVKFLEEEVTNYNTNDKRRVEVNIGVDYKTDLVKAKKIMTDVTTLFPNILKAPEVEVVISEMKDSSIELSLRFWIDSNDKYFVIKSNITETINMSFKKEGIEIPFPQISISNRA